MIVLDKIKAFFKWYGKGMGFLRTKPEAKGEKKADETKVSLTKRPVSYSEKTRRLRNMFREENKTLIWERDPETVLIQPWGRDSFRVRSTISAGIADTHGALLVPLPQNHLSKFMTMAPLYRTIPRRVYTQAHMDVVAEAIKAIYKVRKKTKGLNMVYEPEYLRSFQARFERIM